MSGFHIPRVLRPVFWLLDKFDRKTSPAECPMKHCMRDDCEPGKCRQAEIDREPGQRGLLPPRGFYSYSED